MNLIKHLSIISIICFVLIYIVTVRILNQTNIQIVFSDASCTNACLLGIEPGRTNMTTLEEILSSKSISWEREELGLSGPIVIYSVSTGMFSEPIAQEGEILFWVGQSMESLVGTIQVPIEPTPLNNIISEYGSPIVVAQNDSIVALVYPSEGIVFLSYPENYSVVTKIELRSPENITNYYVETLPAAIPCIDLSLPCGVPTATLDSFGGNSTGN